MQAKFQKGQWVSCGPKGKCMILEVIDTHNPDYQVITATRFQYTVRFEDGATEGGVYETALTAI